MNNFYLNTAGCICFDLLNVAFHFSIQEANYDSLLLKNELPESWVELAFPTEANLREFLNDLQKRVDFFQKWITGSNNNEYWLKAFYLPQAFLTAIQLNFARTFAEVLIS